MKDKILMFIIGVLVGAIIASACFFFYAKNITSQSNQQGMGQPPQMSQNGNSTGMPSGTPPQMPNGNNNSDTNGTTPPALPSNDGNGQQANTQNTTTDNTTNQ